MTIVAKLPVGGCRAAPTDTTVSLSGRRALHPGTRSRSSCQPLAAAGPQLRGRRSFFKSLLGRDILLGMIRPRLQPRQSHPPQHLADRPLMHDHPVTIGDRGTQVEAAPTGYPVDRQVGGQQAPGPSGPASARPTARADGRCDGHRSARRRRRDCSGEPSRAASGDPFRKPLLPLLATLLRAQEQSPKPGKPPGRQSSATHPTKLPRRQLQPRHLDLEPHPVLHR